MAQAYGASLRIPVFNNLLADSPTPPKNYLFTLNIAKTIERLKVEARTGNQKTDKYWSHIPKGAILAYTSDINPNSTYW